MLINGERILERMEELAQTSIAIDLATAWASPGKAMQTVTDRREASRIRSIVGISGWATHPVALRAFNRAGQLRIPAMKPLFHPKVIIYRSVDSAVGWIGSANLTRCGYEQNVELMLEVNDVEQLQSWFDSTWNSLPADVEEVIVDYERRWTPSKQFEDPIAALPENDQSVADDWRLEDGDDWSTYVAKILQANDFWKQQRPKAYWTVDGEGPSWMTTANLGRTIMLDGDLENLSHLEYRILLGIELNGEKSGYGLLGSMKGAGRAKQIFNPNNALGSAVRANVRALLQPVIDCSVEDFPVVASIFVDKASSYDGIAGSVATRMVTLVRPDLGVSVNKGSKAFLARFCGSSLSRITKAAGYRELLEFLQRQPWYVQPRPQNPYELMLASARGAVLDAIAYREDWQRSF